MGKPAQEFINEQVLEKADLLIAIFWTRIGTPTSEHASGTVEEIEKHIDSEKTTMIYFSSQPVALDTTEATAVSSLHTGARGPCLSKTKPRYHTP